MTQRERFLAVMRYEEYDRMPCLHFGYWMDLIDKWEAEGHLPAGIGSAYRNTGGLPDNSPVEQEIDKYVGFDHNYHSVLMTSSKINSSLYPLFEEKVVKQLPDGSQHVLSPEGVIMLKKFRKDGNAVVSIQQHVGHTLTDRASWEAEYKPRLQYDPRRICWDELEKLRAENETRQRVMGLHCGSLMGQIRNWWGFENLIMLQAMDPDLYVEVIDTVADLQYRVVKAQLETGAQFDFAHFWEDIAFKNGPMVTPTVFDQLVGPHYKRITDLLLTYGIDIVSLDCDGVPDAITGTWIENGVNVLFPIEYGTWQGSLRPAREKYGKRQLGVGGMRKAAFTEDRDAIRKEIERLRPLVDMGGYIPTPDHRIPSDAKWENVQYYIELFHKTFS